MACFCYTCWFVLLYLLNFNSIYIIEKEQARMMINSALRGLKESERTTSSELSSQQPIDFNSLTNFVAK